MFFGKTNDDSTSEARINDLKAQITALDARILSLETAYGTLRNKILRKIQKQYEEEEDEERPLVLVAGQPMQRRY